MNELSRESKQERLGGTGNTGLLKLLALVFMFCDHLGAAVLTKCASLRVIGRLALPLYAWCLIVGCVKTRCIWKYALRLLSLAILSQPLYMMALNHGWGDLNILFLLFLGVLCIWGIRENRFGSAIWVPLLCYLLLGFVKIDYGWRGLTFILLLYLCRQRKESIIAVFFAYSLFWGNGTRAVTLLFGIPLVFLTWPGLGNVLTPLFKLQGMIWLALPFLLIPSRQNLHLPKCLSYSLYPLHLVLLIAVRLLSGTSFSFLTRFF